MFRRLVLDPLRCINSQNELAYLQVVQVSLSPIIFGWLGVLGLFYTKEAVDFYLINLLLLYFGLLY